MVGPFPVVPYSFGALRQTFGPLFVRCDVCRQYARPYLAGTRETDYRTKTFSCCRCNIDKGSLSLGQWLTRLSRAGDARADHVAAFIERGLAT